MQREQSQLKDQKLFLKLSRDLLGRIFSSGRKGGSTILNKNSLV